jgi:DNA polymerase-3 subunit delta'
VTDAFSDILGHADAIGFLRDALQAGRLPHGLLFAGPTGVGRFTLASALAGVFLDDSSTTIRRVREQAHPDFHVVTRQLVRLHDATGKSKAIALSAEVIRKELVEPANRKSIEGVGKVFVVKEAGTMNASAQNALLKTLEEPPGRTLIVLLTDRPESLLPTVRSRCQLVRLGELSREDALAVLERHDVPEAEADRAIAVAGNRPGLALRFLADGVVERATAMAERVETGGLAEFLQAAADAQAAADLERDPLGSKEAMTRAGLGLYLGILADQARRRLREQDDLEAECDRIDAIARAERYLAANVNVGLVLRQLEQALAPAA